MFKSLASLCSWAGRFESYLVETPEDRFSHDEAQMAFSKNLTHMNPYHEKVIQAILREMACLEG